MGRAFLRVFLVALPIVVMTATLLTSTRQGNLAVDFRTVSPEIRGLIRGDNPYLTEGLANGGHFLWTITSGWVLAPLAWMPGGYVAMAILEVVALIGALRLLGVRDWRCYALALAWPATVNSVQTANLTLPLVLLLAAAWADHDRSRSRAGLYIGLAVAMKLFLWPTLIWLAATRRWKALCIAAAIQAITLAMTLPYISLPDYLRFERYVADVFAPDSLTLAAALHDLGLPMGQARLITLTLGIAVIWFGRRDLGWLSIAALIVSPVVWLHYFDLFDLLLIPLAIWRPPIWVWCVPFLFIVAPGMGNGTQLQTIGALAALAATITCARLTLDSKPMVTA